MIRRFLIYLGLIIPTKQDIMDEDIREMRRLRKRIDAAKKRILKGKNIDIRGHSFRMIDPVASLIAAEEIRKERRNKYGV